MGRLFWKFFAFFWLAQLTAVVGVSVTVWLIGEQRDRLTLNLDRERLLLSAAGATLRHGGPAAFGEWSRSQHGGRLPPVFAVDEHGRELLGRPAPPPLSGLPPAPPPGARPVRIALPPMLEVDGADGHRYRLFVVRRLPPPDVFAPLRPGFAGPGRPAGEFPLWHRSPLLLPLLLGGIASLVFAALLARYVSKPIRHLRDAFETVAEGRFDVRVGAGMGRRRDELADLGRDFDRMAQRLQDLMQSQRRLLHDVSHELRSPLARLQASIGLMRQGGAAEAEVFMQRLERESVRIDQLVNELLTLARLDAGLGAHPRERVDLTELVHAIADDARVEGEARGLCVELDAAPAAVEGDAALLHRAIENVVRNALKYSPDGGRVRIRSARCGGSVGIEVEDEGPGVPAAELDAIFEPFVRAGTAQKAGGHGLGLAIARRVALAHGGAITAANRAGGGLCVRIALPAAGAEESRTA